MCKLWQFVNSVDDLPFVKCAWWNFRNISYLWKHVIRSVTHIIFKRNDSSKKLFIFKFFFLLRFRKVAKATVSSVMSVCPSVSPPAVNSSLHTVRIFIKFDT